MKAEESTGPAFNLGKDEGVQSQNEGDISQVLLNDGVWYRIVPGSFHVFKPNEHERSMPYVQFDLAAAEGGTAGAGDMRVQVFPATVAGWAFPVPQDTD